MGNEPFVPHRNRHDLHGITVVVDTAERLYVGRLDTADDREIVLKDVGWHEDAGSREEYLARTAKFGVKRRDGMVTIPTGDVTRCEPLAEAVGEQESSRAKRGI